MVTKPYTARSRNRPDIGTVPFISEWRNLSPFADVPANAGVTNAARMLEGWTATRQKALRDTHLEAEVGEWNTVPASLLELLSKYRRAVARIVVPGGQIDFQGIRNDGGWTGTGFLVAPNLLLTNHHVLNSVAVAGSATAEFDYEWPSDKLFANAGTTEPPTVRLELSPTRLFVTSPVTGGGLDYTFVWISEKAAERFGTIHMERGSFMINAYEPTFVIHHPRGRLKEVSLDDTELLAVNSLNILYAADTDYGSSGACVFNRNGRLVALHHARQTGEALKTYYPDVPHQLSDGRPVSVGNEGVKISAIALDLESRMRRGDKDAESAAEILEQIEGPDTLTGIFGALGRRSTSRQDADRVREIYLGSEQDIDIGFWNLHWLFDGAGAPGKVEDAVTAMADLNQDIWCLTDVSPIAVAEIVKALGERFGEKFEAQFSEPDAQVRQLATAVIWRPKMVSCEKAEWPDAVSDAWTRNVPELENQGPIFQAPPGLFQVGAPDACEKLVNVVPISLRAIRSDEMRRRLASKLLVRAIDLVVAGLGNAGDWIVGGDFDPPLAHGDSDALRTRDYEPMAASDTQRGCAVNYLRSPSSGIRNVFVTADLTLVANKGDFFEVVQNRTVDRFTRKLADSRPAVLRLSLDVAGEKTSEQRLDEILDATLVPGSSPRSTPHLQRAAGTAAQPAQAWSDGLTWRGLNKLGFLSANRGPLARLLAEVAAQQRRQYSDLSPLTEVDLWVITFAEAGLGAGGVDPSFRHSNGEIGLYPLPNNIAFWIGAGAPPWNQPMPIENNIESYALYLDQIRNKSVATVGGRTLYRDLFRAPGIAGAPERQARLLAGIVHGYFVSRNYRSRSVPFDRILSGLAADEPVDRILAGTGYVHDGTTILSNRQRNIDAAIAAFRSAGSMQSETGLA
ncbi:serine protease [Rhizobiaceae bacterium n13]|uniref:serine protease n=1 Tax=Ferirhizobium litorale TaxID=2927786 RepID=UPI0024B2EDC3|nr:serine protease [Fererhizobium litorale]MDI7865323.1 serine protease [Fererhizobium litorale]